MSVGEPPVILALETSCDETAVAVMRGKTQLIASRVWSQAGAHAPFGGVVPEMASRQHGEVLPDLVAATLSDAGLAMSDLSAVAATIGPGLPSALLVGIAMAKGIAVGLRKPFLAINHVEGHLLSPFFGREEIPAHIGLVVSGGHTLLVDVRAAGDYSILGTTLDDAAGEAFDKVAKLLGLGYPGGIEIDRQSRSGNPEVFSFPRSMMHSGDFDFSFSGLKTAVRTFLEKEPNAPLPDVCASFQEAVVDVLVTKALGACAARGRNLLGVSGGVSSNRRLQVLIHESAERARIEVVVARPELRTDNAAMIAYVAAHQWANDATGDWDSDVVPTFQRQIFEQSMRHSRPIR